MAIDKNENQLAKRQQENNQSERLDIVLKSLQEFAKAQIQETEIRKQELNIRQKEIESNERIANKAIETQRNTLNDKYAKYNRHLVNRYWFILILLGMVLMFAAYALVNNAKDLVIEAMKILLGFTTGLIGGYHWGMNKKNTSEAEN